MKKVSFIVLAIVAMVSVYFYARSQDVYVIPEPVKVTTNKFVSFKLSNPIVVHVESAEAQSAANCLSERLTPATGYLVKTGNKPGAIELNINKKRNAEIGPEGYTLDVTSDKVIINANTSAGLFYGVQTLLQLLPKEIENHTIQNGVSWTIPGVNIVDYPRFAWRGIMLDVSRHFFSVDEVKHYIDNISRYKYNVFHWHLTDDHGWRIEIKSLPRLTEIGGCRVKRAGKFGDYEWPKDGEPATDCGYYTQEQIKDVIAYAAARHIQVMPEIDVPGHSAAAIAAYPDLSCTNNPKAFVNPGSKVSEWYKDGTFKLLIDNSLDPANERVYTFLDTVFTEVAGLFPFKYIHMGGDECYHGYWEKDPGCQKLMREKGLKNSDELQSYFVKRAAKIIEAKGKKVIGWDEILKGGLAPDAAVMSWTGMQGGTEAAKQGHEVVMTPNQYTYIDLPQGDISVEPECLTWGSVRLKKAYEFEPIPDGIDPKYILGGQANLWAEKVYDMHHGEYMTYPRAWALSDVFWSPKAKRDWPGFVSRMEKQMPRADIAGINYARSAYDAIVRPYKEKGKLKVELSTEIEGETIYYSFDGGEYKQYKEPIDIPSNIQKLSVYTTYGKDNKGKTITLPLSTLLTRTK